MQHQNAQAERGIKTLMYVAHFFLIYAPLHWTKCGVDDLAICCEACCIDLQLCAKVHDGAHANGIID